MSPGYQETETSRAKAEVPLRGMRSSGRQEETPLQAGVTRLIPARATGDARVGIPGEPEEERVVIEAALFLEISNGNNGC